MTHREKQFGWLYMGIQFFILPSLLQFINLLLPISMTAEVLNFWFFTLNFLFTILVFHRFLRKTFYLARRRMGWTLQSAALGFFAYSIGTALISQLCTRIYPDFANINDASISALLQRNYSLMAIGTVFFVPLTEECLFRGLVFGGLHEYSKPAAYLLSAALFSAIHVAGYIGLYPPLLLVLCFLQYLPAGLSLAWAYCRSGSLAAPILIHMTINAMGIYTMR